VHPVWEKRVSAHGFHHPRLAWLGGAPRPDAFYS
jgi:hypothetical protein